MRWVWLAMELVGLMAAFAMWIVGMVTIIRNLFDR